MESIRERLEAEFTALEAANVHAILDSTASVPKVLSKINAAFTKLEDLELTLDVFDGKLSAMRDDIATIESRNNSLETQARSLERLQRTIKDLLSTLTVCCLLCLGFVSLVNPCQRSEGAYPADCAANRLCRTTSFAEHRERAGLHCFASVSISKNHHGLLSQRLGHSNTLGGGC